MSTSTTYTIKCDTVDCQTRIEFDAALMHPRQTVGAARACAREAGWYCGVPLTKQFDYCPEHNPEKVCPNCKRPMPCEGT